MFMISVAPHREGFADDFRIGGNAPWLLDWGPAGFGKDGFDTVHTTIEIVTNQTIPVQGFPDLFPIPIATSARPLDDDDRPQALGNSQYLEGVPKHDSEKCSIPFNSANGFGALGDVHRVPGAPPDAGYRKINHGPRTSDPRHGGLETLGAREIDFAGNA